MSKRWYWRVRYYGLVLTTGSLAAFTGCGLSDQQWASVWQAIITNGLVTVVQNALGGNTTA